MKTQKKARTVSANRQVAARLKTLTNEDLLREDLAELDALYRSASVPKIRAIDGPFQGYMLSLAGSEKLPAALRDGLRALAKSRLFPWRGKSFRPIDDTKGEGKNRILSDSRPLQWFRFETSVKPSLAGDFAAVELDYDLPGNPGLIRMVKDELRQVNERLFLGRAYWKTAGGPRFVLYFGLQKA